MINWNVTFDEASFTSYGPSLDSTDLDPGKQKSLRDLLTNDVQLAGQEWGKYLSGPPLGLDANIDVQIIIDDPTKDDSTERLETEAPRDNPLQLDSNVVHIGFPDALFYQYGAAFEVNTGLDLTFSQDVVIHVNPDFLKNDLWLDPDPTTLPADKADAVSVFAHEIGHALAFNGFMSNALERSGNRHTPFDDQVVRQDDTLFINGENAKFVWHGNPVPLNWQAGVEGSDPYHLEGDLAAPALKNDLMSSGTTYRFQAGTRYDISNLDLAILADSGVNVDAPLTRAPSTVTVVDERHSFPVDNWFASQDPNGEPLTWYALWDYNPDPNSGHFWIPNGGDQPAEKVIVVSESDFHNSRFVSGSVSGSDELLVAASDAINGEMWGPWAHSIVETALPSDFSLIA